MHHNPDDPSQPAALVSPDQQAQADATVQRLLAPFIAELGAVREELGRVKSERDMKDSTMVELRHRAEAAEAELSLRREQEAVAGALHQRRIDQERQNEAGMEEPPEAAPGGLWARLGRWWRG